MLDAGFALMDPVANYVSKYVRLYENIDNDEFVENFGRMEQWLDEGIDVAGETYIQFLRDIYQENKLQRNEMYLDGDHVDVTDIEVPVLQITGEYDHLIPPEASKPMNERFGSDDTEIIEYSTGHIGLAVSGSSHRDVWPRVAEWYIEKSTDDPEHLAAVETAVEEATDQIGIEEINVDVGTDAERTDVEAVDGVGPTYAERLRAADIGTAANLAESDPETVADAADVSPDRAEKWIRQVRE
jgi:polyhydroxyalkanoate synthase